MKKQTHHGVGLLISNLDQSRFFVQIKDQEYPFLEWRGACAYWGGAIELDDFDELSAVERELEEEIPAAALLLKNFTKNKIDQYWVADVAEPFWLTLFEVLVSDGLLMQIADVEVLEGDGALMTKEELLDKKWIWKMDFVFKDYLERKKNN